MTMIGLPVHPLAEGVTVYVTAALVLVVVFKIWATDVPLPSDAPVTPLCRTVQLKVVPDTLELRAMEDEPPLQIVWLEGVAATSGPRLSIPQFHVSPKI